MSGAIIGWDIGGVNTKVALVAAGALIAVRSRPFELQRDPEGLAPVLRLLAAELAPPHQVVHAVTMTGELSQYFRTKREGVRFILEAVRAAFPHAPIEVFTVAGAFTSFPNASSAPYAVAASNWRATAEIVAQKYPSGVLIDVGTTTTDIVPLAEGRVAAIGRSDPERLAANELLYLGALRTPVEAIAHDVRIGGRTYGVSAEGFALAGDVHLWRGDLDPTAYTVPTPDGRPATREFALERLARVVCADREFLSEHDIDEIADYLAECQVTRLAAAIERVQQRYSPFPAAITAGLGEFVAARAARLAGLPVISFADVFGSDASRSAPAAAVALLRASTL